MRPRPEQDQHTEWWRWVQRRLDAAGWTNADLARAARQHSASVDESVISRWKNRNSVPELGSVRAVASAFGVDLREAIVAAGLLTEAELRAPINRSLHDLASVPDEILLAEIAQRMARRTPVSPKQTHSSRPAAQPLDGVVNGSAATEGKESPVTAAKECTRLPTDAGREFLRLPMDGDLYPAGSAIP